MLPMEVLLNVTTAPFVTEVKFATGTVFTVMYETLVKVSDPLGLVARSVMGYVPAIEYITVGFGWLDAAGIPPWKVH
jgi:hypothetical protein